MENLKDICEVAKQAAMKAGEYALSRVSTDKIIDHKSGMNDLVTDVDKKCEAIVIEIIKKSFPEHSILGEESGEEHKSAGYTWVIDPIDGTTNYAHGFPVFCTSVGVMIDGQSVVGVVYDPSRDELFHCVKGEGAFLNGDVISVSEVKTVSESLIATGFAYNLEKKIANLGYFRKMLECAQAVRRPGAAAIDLCYVACGRMDGFWELGLKPWDTAAGYLLVTESGGKVTALNGEYFDVNNPELLASNGHIHEEMFGILKD